MLRASFVCLDGIGEAAERKLWRMGCLRWEYFLVIGRPVFSPKKTERVIAAIAEAEHALTLRRADYFVHRLPVALAGRVYADFFREVGYLDVETTGLSQSDQVTAATLVKAGEIHFFVNGWNLFEIIDHIAGCRLLVTFNGNRFDVPLLHRTLKMDLLVPHLDLRPTLAAMGLHGDLKSIEKQLGIKRRSIETDGKAAVGLWRDFRVASDRASLRRLLEYNAEDAVVLEALMRHAYSRSMSGFPIARCRIPPSPSPDIRVTCQEFLQRYPLGRE